MVYTCTIEVEEVVQIEMVLMSCYYNYLIIFHAVDPPTITIQPMSMTVAVGSNVTFSVTATSQDNVLTYQWFKDDVIFPSATEPILRINNVVDESDEGVYSVKVFNSEMVSTTSMNASLTVSKWVK